MTRILLLTNHPKRFSEFADILSKESDNQIEWFESQKNFLGSIVESAPKLVVIDETVDGFSALAVAREVVMANAMVYIAVVTSLSSEEFHEASEGLGILSQLPPTPGPQEAESLMALLKGMSM